MRWQLGQRITSALRWIWLKSWGGTRMRQPWQIPPRTSTTARPPRREKIISYLRRRSPSIVCTSSERVARSRSISLERRASVSRSSLASRSRSAASRASSVSRPASFAVAPSHLPHHGHHLGLEGADPPFEQTHPPSGQPDPLSVAVAVYRLAPVLHLAS